MRFIITTVCISSDKSLLISFLNDKQRVQYSKVVWRGMSSVVYVFRQLWSLQCVPVQFWKTDRVTKSGKTRAISLNILKYIIYVCTLIIYQPLVIDHNI